MLAAPFEFFAPTKLDDALGLLAEREGGRLLAGGMSLVPTLNLGRLKPAALISLNHVAGLDKVEDAGDTIRIGALVRHARVETDPLIRRHARPLSTAASQIGDVQVRHRGTIGGSIANADPAADYLPAIVALGATVRIASAAGTRTVEALDLFVDAMTTSLKSSEAIVELEVPKLPADVPSAYLRFTRIKGSFPIVAVAAVLGRGRSVVAVGGAVPAPVTVELPDELDADAVGDAAYDACSNAYGDVRSPPAYRRAMARVFARRAVEAALAGAEGGR
jgi:aerobic carbon-monoxide dehydrogenase medium subunit